MILLLLLLVWLFWYAARAEDEDDDFLLIAPVPTVPDDWIELLGKSLQGQWQISYMNRLSFEVCVIPLNLRKLCFSDWKHDFIGF